MHFTKYVNDTNPHVSDAMKKEIVATLLNKFKHKLPKKYNRYTSYKPARSKRNLRQMLFLKKIISLMSLKLPSLISLNFAKLVAMSFDKYSMALLSLHNDVSSLDPSKAS